MIAKKLGGNGSIMQAYDTSTGKYASVGLSFKLPNGERKTVNDFDSFIQVLRESNEGFRSGYDSEETHQDKQAWAIRKYNDLFGKAVDSANERAITRLAPKRSDFDPNDPTKGYENVNTPRYWADPYGKKYSHNCQRCVIAFELWCRGYDAKAGERKRVDDIFDKKTIYIDTNVGGLPYSYSIQASKWLSAIFGAESRKWEGYGKYKRVKSACEGISDEMEACGEGARFIMHYATAYNAHVFNVVVKDGKAMIYDAQDAKGRPPEPLRGKSELWSYYGIKPSELFYIRVDDKQINPSYLDDILLNEKEAKQ